MCGTCTHMKCDMCAMVCVYDTYTIYLSCAVSDLVEGIGKVPVSKTPCYTTSVPWSWDSDEIATPTISFQIPLSAVRSSWRKKQTNKTKKPKNKILSVCSGRGWSQKRLNTQKCYITWAKGLPQLIETFEENEDYLCFMLAVDEKTWDRCDIPIGLWI